MTYGQSGGFDTVFIKYDTDGFDEKLEYTIDTFVFESANSRNILIGTDVLHGTYNQQTLWSYGLYLNDISSTDCQTDRVEGLSNRINYISETDSTLTVDLTIVSNCCHSFLADTKIDTLSQLNLIYYGYGGICGCNCCFGLQYHFKKDEIYPTENKVLKVLINEDENTIVSFKKIKLKK
jgi:hypothetical protein